MKEFNIQIATPDRAVYDGPIEKLLVRTTEGDVEILFGHANYLATIAAGRIQFAMPGGVLRTAAVSGGFLSVIDSNVKLIVTTFEYPEEIDIERAYKAREHALEALKQIQQDEKQEKIIKSKLMRSLARIEVAKK